MPPCWRGFYAPAPFRLLQRAADNAHRIAARRQIEQTAGHRRHAKINITGSNGDRHRLRRLKRDQLGVQPLGGKIPALLGDKTRCLRRQRDITNPHLLRRLHNQRRDRQNRRQRDTQQNLHKTSEKEKPRNGATGTLFNIAVMTVQAAHPGCNSAIRQNHTKTMTNIL